MATVTGGSQLAKNNGNGKTKGPAGTIWSLMCSKKEAIAKALPKHITPEKMMQVAFTEIRKNPMLLRCDPSSLIGATLQASQLGMMPGPLGQCYFVPFRNGKTGTYDVQFMLGYKGMIELARRSGHVTSVYAHCVYEGEPFSVRYGTEEKIEHAPCLDGNKGPLLGVYAVAKIKDGDPVMTFLTVEDVQKYRDRSKSKGNCPWVTDFEAMAMKTAVRRLFSWLPVSVDAVETISQDERVITGENPLEDAIDIEAVVHMEEDDGSAEDSQPAQEASDALPLEGEKAR